MSIQLLQMKSAVGAAASRANAQSGARSHRRPQSLTRLCAAGALLASLGIGAGARATILGLTKDGICYRFDTDTNESSESAGDCQGTGTATPVRGVRDLFSPRVAKLSATTATLVDGAYTAIIEANATVMETEKFAVFAVGGGHYAVRGEITASVNFQVSKAGWKSFAAPDLDWRPETSVVALTLTDVPVVYFSSSLTENSLVGGLAYAARTQVNRIADLFTDYIVNRRSPIIEFGSFKADRLFLSQITNVNQSVLLATMKKTLEDVSSQLVGQRNPGFAPTEPELIAQLEAQLERSSQLNKELLAQVANSEAAIRALNDRVAALDQQARQCSESVSALTDANQILEVERERLESELASAASDDLLAQQTIGGFHDAYVALGVAFDYPGWDASSPSYNGELIGFVSQAVRDLWNVYDDESARRQDLERQLAEVQGELLAAQAALKVAQGDAGRLAAEITALEGTLDAVSSQRDAYVAATATYTKSLYERLGLTACSDMPCSDDALRSEIVAALDTLLSDTETLLTGYIDLAEVFGYRVPGRSTNLGELVEVVGSASAALLTQVETLTQTNATLTQTVAERDAYVAATATYTKGLYQRLGLTACTDSPEPPAYPDDLVAEGGLTTPAATPCTEMELQTQIVEAIAASQGQLVTCNATVSGLQGDLIEAHAEPRWRILEAVAAAVRNNELIDSRYLEDQNLDAVMNGLNDQIASIRQSLDCLLETQADAQPLIQLVDAATGRLATVPNEQCNDRAAGVAWVVTQLVQVRQAIGTIIAQSATPPEEEKPPSPDQR